MVLAQRLLSNHNGLLVQLNGFLKFPLPRTNTNKWGVKSSSTLSKAQVRCQKLKYDAKSSSTLPKAQVRRGVLENMTAYLRVAHVYEGGGVFETPISLHLTARRNEGFSQA